MADKINAVTAQNADNRLALAPDGTVMRVPARKLPPDLSDAVKAAGDKAADAASVAKQAEDKATQALKLAQRALPKVLFVAVGNNTVYKFIIDGKVILSYGRATDGSGRGLFAEKGGRYVDIVINSATNPGIQPQIAPNSTWFVPNNLNHASCCTLISPDFLITVCYAAQDNNGASFMQVIGVDAITAG